MNTTEITDIAAERNLEHPSFTIRAILGKPRFDNENNYFVCPFQIIGIGSETVFEVGGEDSMQALYLATQALRHRLAHIQKEFDHQITWLGDIDLGFELSKLELF